MKEARDQFVVRVIDSVVAGPSEADGLDSHVGRLQSFIILTRDEKTSGDFTIHIDPGDGKTPYLVKGNEAELAVDFFHNSHITLPSTYYLAYFLAIALLENLIQTRLDMALKVFPREFCPAANEYIWRGSIPVSSQATVDRLRGETAQTGQLVTAIEQVLRGTGRLYQKLTTKARMVADQLERWGLPTSDDVYRQIVSVFMYSDQKRVADVADDIGSGHPAAVDLLTDLAADCPHADAVSLLETLLKAKNLDEGDRDFIETALKRQQGQRLIQEQVSIKADAEIITLEPASATLRTGGITVSISPSIIGNRPHPATAESKKPVDALNYKTYANAFGDLITNPETGTPLTIGICAPWGRGKTVLLNYIQDRIKKNAGEKASCQCIEFNAWEYTKAEQLWAAFYSTILDAVEGSLQWWRKLSFKLHVMRRADGWSMALRSVFYLVILGLVGTFVFTLEYAPYWGATAAVVSAILGLWKVPRRVSKNVLSPPTRLAPKATISVRREIFRRIDIVRNWLIKKHHKRVVVFIDDIDRCSPDKIMQMLESIKLLLNTKNFVFILGMDAKVVRLAIGQHYKFMAETPAKREEMGRSYLEKIVQIPFALPQASPDDLVNMKNELFKGLLEKEDKVGKAKGTAPNGKITPLPEETTEDDKKGSKEGVTRVESIEKGEKTPRPKPKVDRELEMHLTIEESKTLDALLKEKLDLSPRLLTRLKNVYLIARHLYLADNDTEKPIPPAFMRWIACSVRFPFASKAVAEACEKNGWDEEWSQLFDSLSSRNREKPDEYNFDPVELEELQTRLSGHISHPKEIERFIKHANCFNLVLD